MSKTEKTHFRIKTVLKVITNIFFPALSPLLGFGMVEENNSQTLPVAFCMRWYSVRIRTKFCSREKVLFPQHTLYPPTNQELLYFTLNLICLRLLKNRVVQLYCTSFLFSFCFCILPWGEMCSSEEISKINLISKIKVCLICFSWC